MSKFKREFSRYLVFKTKDVETALSIEEKALLAFLATKINCQTINRRKKPLECVVIESDWPEYEKVWSMIERRCSE